MGPPSTLSPPGSASRVPSGSSWSSQMHGSCSRCGPVDQERDPTGHEAQVVNARLVEELRSVVVMNDKWQKYHQQQKTYVSELQASVEEHKVRAREADKRYSQLQIALRLQEGRTRELEETVCCFSSAMDETDELRRARDRLEEEVRKLKDSLRDRRGSADEKKEHDRNQLLQEQLQVCIEDFKKEEAEKVKLQKEFSSLSSKLIDTNRLLKEYRDKVGMMQAISFPSIGQADVPVNAIPKDALSVHRRRNKVSTSAPSRSGISCRLDGIVNFPTTIEADCYGGGPQKGFELVPRFSSSLESDKGTVSDNSSEHDSLETHVELVRH